MHAPPDYIIDRARRVALLSPCAKSKRGVVLYSPELAEEKVDPGNALGACPTCARSP